MKKECQIEEKIITNSRSIIPPLELDFYLPDFNLAIEFNGIYWHSESKRIDKNYHLDKTLKCQSKGIQLIHIFENEWINKQEIVKSILRYKLKKSKKLCGARQCQIKEVLDSKEKNNFIERNHLQGADQSSIKLGAFYQNQLVSIMTFSKPSLAKGRKDQQSKNFELSRFCSLLNCSIPGIASKFINYFKKNYEFDELYTFADRRYSNGNVYRQIEGFIEVHPSSPNYWYFHESDCLNLKHRFTYRKSELSKILEIFDSNLTEYQNMVVNGYDRIWDCGNLKFVYVQKKKQII